MSISLSFRTEESTQEDLDRLASLLNRSRNWVINEAIAAHLATHRWQLEQIEKGLEDVRAGRTFSPDEIKQRIASKSQTAK